MWLPLFQPGRFLWMLFRYMNVVNYLFLLYLIKVIKLIILIYLWTMLFVFLSLQCKYGTSFIFYFCYLLDIKDFIKSILFFETAPLGEHHYGHTRGSSIGNWTTNRPTYEAFSCWPEVNIFFHSSLLHTEVLFSWCMLMTNLIVF